MALPVLLAVDGNALIHRSYHARAHTGHRLADGRPGWAVQGLLTQLVSAVDRACASVVVVGFDDPRSSVRRDRWPHYKAQRPAKLATLVSQLEVAVDVLNDLGVAVVVPPGLEADDVLASAAASARKAGMQTVLVSSDRDCFALVDGSTRLLRVVDGGLGGSPMIDARRLEIIVGVRPDQYVDLAALRGDPSDNLPGVRGVGPAAAVRLLSTFGSAAAVFADAAAGGDRLRKVVGPALANRLAEPASLAKWQRNCAVMAMHTDLPLGLLLGLSVGLDRPQGAGHLPLDEAAVRRVYQRLELGEISAVRSLCRHAPGLPRYRDEDQAWQPRPRRASTRFAPLRRSRQVHVQERLF